MDVYESDSLEAMVSQVLENVRRDILLMHPLAFIVVRWTPEGIVTELNQPLLNFGPTIGELLEREKGGKSGAH